ncbi:MAG: DUF3850 domain-containing protein [Rouxiella badensis]|uniref:DUF3850 domain-containing protein n=1 Tax=Rouxiella badensis TaxID=1646377 RepID=UPI003C61F65A
MQTHELKIKPEHFDPVFSGKKTAELRKNDRDYKAGDLLKLREFLNGDYTGSYVWRRITHVADVGDFAEGYVLLSITPATLFETARAA